MKKLIRSINQNQRDEYIVQVFKSNISGVPHTRDPYYEQRYLSKEEALDSHRNVVRLLADGKLSLKRIRTNLD